MSMIENSMLNWEQVRSEILTTLRTMNHETVEEQQQKLRSDVLYVNGVHQFTALFVELTNLRKEREVAHPSYDVWNMLERSLEPEPTFAPTEGARPDPNEPEEEKGAGDE